jgi:hypothetical protein
MLRLCWPTSPSNERSGSAFTLSLNSGAVAIFRMIKPEKWAENWKKFDSKKSRKELPYSAENVLDR